MDIVYAQVGEYIRTKITAAQNQTKKNSQGTNLVDNIQSTVDKIKQEQLEQDQERKMSNRVHQIVQGSGLKNLIQLSQIDENSSEDY